MKFNVGGVIFETTIATISSEPNMLSAMLSGNFSNPANEKGEIVLKDRFVEEFAILNL